MTCMEKRNALSIALFVAAFMAAGSSYVFDVHPATSTLLSGILTGLALVTLRPVSQ